MWSVSVRWKRSPIVPLSLFPVQPENIKQKISNQKIGNSSLYIKKGQRFRCPFQVYHLYLSALKGYCIICIQFRYHRTACTLYVSSRSFSCSFIPKNLISKRTEVIEKPVEQVKTAEFLFQNEPFRDTPEELKDKANYYVSDDDRIFWWDGSEEVILSEEMHDWLSDQQKRYP